MSFSPYLNFNGNTKEAIYFYKEAFQTKEPEIMLFSEMPPDDDFPVTEEIKDLVMHGSLDIKGTKFMFTDTTKGNEVKFGNNITLMFDSKVKAEIEHAYKFLSEGGTVIMPLQKTFWSESYGYLEDKFGVGWQFNLSE